MTGMMTVTEEDILEKVTESSFERGRIYYKLENGRIGGFSGETGCFAEVLGSGWEPYRVGVALQEDDFSASCTCPYDWGGYCKHVVAVLLTLIHDRDRITKRAPTEDLLSKLGRRRVEGARNPHGRIRPKIGRRCRSVLCSSHPRIAGGPIFHLVRSQ